MHFSQRNFGGREHMKTFARNKIAALIAALLTLILLAA